MSGVIASAASDPALRAAIKVVAAYLQALEARDIDRAQACLAESFQSIGPGGHESESVAGIVANSSRRYRRIGKHISHYDALHVDDFIVVYCQGTLHGAWPDGREFSHIRFIDRFELRNGLIIRQEVWNDTGEYRIREGLIAQ